MQLFYAFNSTQVWHFNAFVVGNKQQKKTFAGVMYDEQKNIISLHDITSRHMYFSDVLCDQGSILKEIEARPQREVHGEYFLRE